MLLPLLMNLSMWDIRAGAGRPVGIDWQVGNKKVKKVEPIESLVKRLVSDYYQDLVVVSPKIAKESAKIVRPYAKDGEKIPVLVDWAKLEQDAKRVQELLSLWQEQVRGREYEEELLIMMMV